ALRLLAAGEFPPGSMGPKVEAAVQFIERGGQEAVITSLDRLTEALEGRAGTHIVAAA
ncbi:MAG: carbamate kinase, partial [Dehalococcoidia bacterium]|nr:carbamate kinase [Dehalococcoidia bacterium]